MDDARKLAIGFQVLVLAAIIVAAWAIWGPYAALGGAIGGALGQLSAAFFEVKITRRRWP